MSREEINKETLDIITKDVEKSTLKSFEGITALNITNISTVLMDISTSLAIIADALTREEKQ